jgi:hypothetical protein
MFLFSMAYSQVKSRYQEENVIPPSINYMTAWGPVPGSPPLGVTGDPPRVTSGIPVGSVTVDGRLLDKYKKRFDLMVIALHIINSESYMDKDGVSKSKLIKIRPEDLLIKVDYNAQFLVETEMGANAAAFVLLAIPKGMKPEDFKTLNGLRQGSASHRQRNGGGAKYSDSTSKMRSIGLCRLRGSRLTHYRLPVADGSEPAGRFTVGLRSAIFCRGGKDIPYRGS